MRKFKDVELTDEIIKSGLFQKYKSEILKLFEKVNNRNYFIKRMGSKHSDLKEVDFILDELKKVEDFYNGPYAIFEIFDNSVNKENSDFILKFTEKNYKCFKHDKQRKNDSLDLVVQLLDKVQKIDPEKVDEVFRILKNIFGRNDALSRKELRDYRFNRDYEKQLITELLEKISEIYFQDSNLNRIKNVVEFIYRNFNLVDDDSQLEMYTSRKIFGILKKYIGLNFEENFEEVLTLIIKQYKVVWREDFDGWEFSGGGISQSGNYFSITDRYFNEYTFIPAINEYYEKTDNDKNKAWDDIKRICYTKNSTDISFERPEFLNRAIILLLFRRFSECEGIDKAEALDILDDFIKARKGIPHKADLIYQYIYKNIESFSNDDLWVFVQIVFSAEWNKKRTAPNVFVEKIISKLAEDKHEDAVLWLEESIDEPEMTVDRYWEGGVIETVKKFINSEIDEDRKKGISMFGEYVTAEKFYDKLDRFGVFSVAELLANIIDLDLKKGMEIVLRVYNNKELTMNQQILITTGINRISNFDSKISVFAAFFEDMFKKMGEVDNVNEITGDVAKTVSKKIEKRFDHDYARVAIVEMGKLFAENKKLKEAMVIARIFINDVDPRIDDKEYNYHQKIIDGDEGGNTISVSTVRGWVCWLLSNVPVLGGEEYIEEVVSMTDSLTKDENYYIRYMSTFPLSQLIKVRHTVVKSGTAVRFMPIDVATNIESIAFAMLREGENRQLKAVMSGMVRVFNSVRNLDSKKALEVLEYFKEVEDEEILMSIVSLFIFYVEFRKDSFDGELWKDSKFDYMNEFNNKDIKKLHDKLLVDGNDKIKSAFALKYATLMDEGDTPDEKEKYYNISLKNLRKIIKKYSPHVYDDIYRFIDDNIENEYDDSILLLKTAIENESKAMEELSADHEYRQFAWRGFYDFEKIFKVIFDKNKKDYLDYLELIIKIKIDGFLLTHLKAVVSNLIQIKGEEERIEGIFDYLIENVSLDFYDLKVDWEKK